MGTFFGLVGLVLVWWVMAALNKQHIKDHGVPAPSRKALARIRRTGRQKGISQQAAYDQWVVNKQRRMPKQVEPLSPSPGPLLTTPAPDESQRAAAYTLPTNDKGSAWKGLAFAGIIVAVVIGIARPWPGDAPQVPVSTPKIAESPLRVVAAVQPAPAVPTPTVADLPKLDGPSLSRPRLPEAKVAPPPIATPSPVVRIAEGRVRTAPRRRGRGGCGSRGGPGYRLANGRCASHRR